MAFPVAKGTGVADAASLKAALANGGEISLVAPIETTSETAVVIESGKKVTLHLNGQSIKTNVAKLDAIVVAEGGELVVDGNGSIEAAATGGNGFAMVVKGKATLNGGNYKSGVDEKNDANACIYAQENGKIYVNGGQYESADGTFVLNKEDDDRETTTIEVRGGSFYKFDPANNASENPGTNFVAAGYKSVKVGEWYKVVEE